MKTLIIILLLVAPAFAQTPAPKPRFVRWGGLFVSVARTAPITERRFSWRDVYGEGTVLINVGKRGNIQLEFFKSFTSGDVFFRAGVGFQVF